MATEGFEKYRAAMSEEAVRFAKRITDELRTPAGMEVWGNYLLDLPGPRVLRCKISLQEEVFRFLFYGFSEIAETYEHLQDF